MTEIRYDLKKYIDHHIIVMYRDFDKAHGQEHIAQVIDKSIFLAEKTGADKEMAYVTAAYHDIGLVMSREGHGFRSARMLEADVHLPVWFSRAQLHIMAEAVEDHSTSLAREPRSLYGKIIYQADMIFDAEIVIKRSFCFGVVHYQEYTFEEQVERVYGYVNGKYGENGLVRLWIDIPEERVQLRQLQKKIKDRDYVCCICRKYQ